MCGISGILDTARQSGDKELKKSALEMVSTLRHRGPDDFGAWADEAAGIALGHRRLAILDLSPEGHQPMRSACGRYIVTFNGEIYNFQELRMELENKGYAFRGHSDTEVMLSCFSEWGVVDATRRLNGMFAFALWDREKKLLHLVRDRLGEKPLYYGWVGKAFVFGSELKALRVHPNFVPEVDRDALALFLRSSYVPAPYSIYKGISKLLPGTIATVTCRNVGRPPTPVPFWSVRAEVEQGRAEPFHGSETDAVATLEELLKDSVKHRMVADVPLGAFLSGGIDSSTIVALMQIQSARPIQTFTVGFHEKRFNEAEQAKAVARHLGTAHTELYLTPEETLAVIPKLPTLYDEPFADASQVPTFLISQLARQDVTVVLSGDGGDELFGGYERYFIGHAIWKKLGWLRPVTRVPVVHGLRLLTPQSWDAIFQIINPLLPKLLRYRNPGDKLHKLAEMLMAGGADSMYVLMGSHWIDPTSVVIGASEPMTVFTDPSQRMAQLQLQERMMYMDLMAYLPDDVLVKVDRASMGVSLETRVPFLDHRLVEFAWRLPLSMKIRNGRGKWLLRQLLYKYVPAPLVDRPKMGFGVPIDQWLRGPLREWAEELIDEKKLKDQGFFSPEPIRKKWTEHLAGTSNWQYDLWDILMFQAWLEHERKHSLCHAH